jgi:creatinine amidohydrolase/Fe(II)-dependent formamide hydrolase-like protein
MSDPFTSPRMPKRLSETTSQDVDTYLQTSSAIIVPFGSLEQHASASPVGTDAAIAAAPGDELSLRTGVLVAPTLPLGVSAFHSQYRGTISLSPQSYIAVVRDILHSLLDQRFRRLLLLLINAHFENSGLLRATAEELLAHCKRRAKATVLAEGRDAQLMATAGACEVLQFQGSSDARSSALVLPETMRSRTSRRW